MKRRFSCVLRRRAGVSLLATLTAWPAAAMAGRNWQEAPAVLQQPQPATLYVVGDIHGDEDTLAALLTGTHLVTNAGSPATTQWNAGTATLLCTGDVIDKYDQELPAIALLRSLQSQAAAAGGQVIVTMGNHEAEFLAGVDAKGDFFHELKTNGIDPQAVIAGTDAGGVGAWMRSLPVAAKLGDWFFCHAGNTAGLTVEQIETTAEQEIDSRGFDTPFLLGPDSLLEARMHPRPWWDYDGSGVQLKNTKAQKHDGTDPGQARLLSNLQQLGVSHLVIGHQPGEVKFLDGTHRPADTVYEKWDNTFILIDTGMSRGVDHGRGAVLQITGEHVVVHYGDGSTTAVPPG